MTALTLSNLYFTYPEQDTVLADINLSLLSGDSVGLIGSNGSGKTTLFYLIAGILTPNKGEIKVFDKTVIAGDFNSRIGFLFQNPDDQLFSSTVYDDISFGLLNLGIPADEIDQRVDTALGNIDGSNLKHRPPQHLSLGEKRMVALETVLAMDPKLLLLDEPTSNLDMKARRKLIHRLRSIEICKIIASHDIEFVLETCSKVILLNEGSIAAFGSSLELLGDEKLMDLCHQELPWSIKVKR